MVIRASGGTPEPFTTVDEADKFASYRLPFALPDGRGVLFTAASDFGAWDDSAIMVVAGAGDTPKELVKVAAGGRYVPPGYLVFQRQGTLMAAPFDLSRLELTGQPVPVLEGVTPCGPSAPPQFSIDDRGTLLYRAGSPQVDSRLVLIDQSGKEETLGKHTGAFGGPAVSPDGRFVAIEISRDSEIQVAILERSRDILRTLPGGTREVGPVWSPDSQSFVVASNRDGPKLNLYRVQADLSGAVVRLTTSAHGQFTGDWSGDGRLLAFMDISPQTGGDIHLLKFDENGDVGGDPTVLVGDPGWQWGARFSPDGAWISYSSEVSGRPDVFVRPADGTGSAVQVSTDGGNYVHWSPTEKALYYLSLDPDRLSVQVVRYTVEGTKFTPEAPETLFTIEGRAQYDSDYDIMPDGKHFVFARDVEAGGTRGRQEPTIVLNWTQTLKDLIAMGETR